MEKNKLALMEANYVFNRKGKLQAAKDVAIMGVLAAGIVVMVFGVIYSFIIGGF
jgi:hypothetical protein